PILPRFIRAMVLHLQQEASIRVRMVAVRGLLSRTACRMHQLLRWLRPHPPFTRQAKALSKLQMEEVAGPTPLPVYGALVLVVLSNTPLMQRCSTREQLRLVSRMPSLLN